MCVKSFAAVVIAIAMAFGGVAYASTSSSYLSMLNQERASRGVSALHLSADLVGVAQSWSDEMARTGRLQHNPHLESDVPNWWSVGENVGMGPDLPDIEQAFWNSPDHRSNILDADYTDVGIAAAYSHNRYWMTVVFRQPWHHITRHVARQPAPAVVTARPAQHVANTPARKPAPQPLTRILWFARMRDLR